MRRLPLLMLSLVGVSVLSFGINVIGAPPQDGPPPQEGGQQGQADHQPGDRPPSDRPGGGGFHLIPRFVQEKLELSQEQQDQIDQLEKETKAKLEKILTPEQMQILQTARPPRPNNGGQGGGQNRGGPNGGGGGQRPRN